MNLLIESFDRSGFVICKSFIDPTLLSLANAAFDVVLQRTSKNVDVKVIPLQETVDGVCREAPVRIENPQLEDKSFQTIVANRQIGKLISDLTGARVVQPFFAHVTSLPALHRDAPARGIGWHQEAQYPDFIQGPFLTAWVPLCDIEPNNGPLRYLEGSHTFGIYPDKGIRSPLSHTEQREEIQKRTGMIWNEVAAIGTAGMISVHHSNTIHGTFPNKSDKPRRAMVIHYRTEQNPVTRSPNQFYDRVATYYMNNLEMSPIVFGGPEMLGFSETH